MNFMRNSFRNGMTRRQGSLMSERESEQVMQFNSRADVGIINRLTGNYRRRLLRLHHTERERRDGEKKSRERERTAANTKNKFRQYQSIFPVTHIIEPRLIVPSS